MISNSEGDVSVNTEENLVEKRINMVAAFEHVMSIDTGVANIAPPLTLGDNPYATATARLDIDGRLKISDDNIAAPQAGMIRWNDAGTDFEGYDGSEWKSLTIKSSLSYGDVAIKSYPTSTTLPKQNSQKYENARLQKRPGKLAYTAYDTVTLKTHITIEQSLFTSNISFSETNSYPSANRLGLSDNWLAYMNGNTVRTWKSVSGYVEQDDISVGIGGGYFQLIGDGRIVTSRPDASWTSLDLYDFDEDSNQWETTASDLILQSPVFINANSDTLLTIYYQDAKITTYDLSSNSFSQMSEYYYSGNIQDVIYKDNQVILAETTFSNTSISKITFRDATDLNTLDLEILVSEQMWGETPEVILAYESGLLAVGIENATNEQGVKCGKVLLYEITNDNFTKVAELLPSQPQEDMKFGRDIIITDNEILVNAPFFDYDGTPDSGILFTYNRNF